MKKTMKKSMLVTTVLMVLLLIVALSTATFAWYTSNNQATATATELTSATSSSANIALGWSATATTTTVTFEAGTGLVPMVPVWTAALSDATNPGLPTKKAADVTASGAPSFFTATLQKSGADLKFKANASTATPWTQKQGDFVKPEGNETATAPTTLYAINYNTATDAVVTVTATFTKDATEGALDVKDFIRIAVVVDGEYLGTLGTGNMSYAKMGNSGTVGEGDDATDVTWEGKTAAETTATVSCDSSVQFTIAKATGSTGKTATVALYAWLDGNSLVDQYAGAKASFALTFTAA